MSGIGADRIGLNTFKQKTQWLGDEDRALRISKGTGKVTTAEHGFFSKAVRFLFGPRKQDIADNQRLIHDFFKDLRNAYGPEIASAALVRARADTADDGASITYDPAKPLTARQVQDAVKFARAEAAGGRRDRFNQAVGTQILHYGPGGAGFAKAAQAKGVDAKALCDGQTAYVLIRLEEEVARQAKNDGEIPDSKDIKSLAGKLARRAQEMGPGGIEDLARAATRMRAQAAGLVGAMTGGDGADPFPLLSNLLRASSGIASSYAVDPTEMGPEDRMHPAQAAIDHAVSELTPEDARRALDALRDPEGKGFKALVAIELAAESVSSTDGTRLGALGEANGLLGALSATLAARAGVPDGDAAIGREASRAARRGADAHGDEVRTLTASAGRMIDAGATAIAEYGRLRREEDAERAGAP